MFKSFLHHARNNNKIGKSIFKIKQSEAVITIIPDAHIELLMNHLQNSRDKLILKILYLTGARIGEVLDLKIENIPYPNLDETFGVLKNIKSKIAGMRAAEIKNELNNEFKGKTPNEIDDIISDLAESMSFNPLPNGICLYDFRRGNCTDGDGCFFYNCPNYIKEVKFYPILKKELDLMELEMKRLKKLGRERDWQRQYVKHTHLKRLVDELEAQKNG